MKTFEFTEEQRHELIEIFVHGTIQELLSRIEAIVSAPITPEPASDKLIEAFCEKHAILPETLISVYNDNLERIKSILSTPEPGESGQSAEDYLVSNGLQVIGNYMFSMVDVAKMLTTYASHVCADKDREIQHWKDQGAKECIELFHANYELSCIKKELDRLNESLTVMIQMNAGLEKELEVFKYQTKWSHH